MRRDNSAEINLNKEAGGLTAPRFFMNEKQRKIGRIFRYYRSVYINDSLKIFAKEIGIAYGMLSKFERGQNLMAKYAFNYLTRLPEGIAVQLIQDIKAIMEA